MLGYICKYAPIEIFESMGAHYFNPKVRTILDIGHSSE